ncbi:MAG: META domain-containing protein [Flavobacteriales bacterium]|nr:META domain-containing protein [Flavobacteriales bacterium]
MKTISLSALALFVVLFVACGPNHNEPAHGSPTPLSDSTNQVDAHNAQNALDYLGIYKGNIPEVGEVQISLYENNLYSYKIIITQNNMPEFIEEKGKYTWSEDGNYITLQAQDAAPNTYKVEENRLIWLNEKGEVIQGEDADLYMLKKQTEIGVEEPEAVQEKMKPASPKKDMPFYNTRWVLVELNGKSVKSKKMKEAFLVFEEKEKRVSGNGSCNSLNGSIELKEGNRLTFGNIAATKMACIDDNVEDAFFAMLGKVDQYTINGNTLSLNKGKMSPLARFEGK